MAAVAARAQVTEIEAEIEPVLNGNLVIAMEVLRMLVVAVP